MGGLREKLRKPSLVVFVIMPSIMASFVFPTLALSLYLTAKVETGLRILISIFASSISLAVGMYIAILVARKLVKKSKD